MDVLLNQIDIEKSFIDCEKINENFDFFLIKNTSGSFYPNRQIIDGVGFSKNILAIQFTGGKSFILMLKKDLKNFQLVSNFIKEYNKENNNGLERELLVVSKSDYYFYSIIQVMFNALAKRGQDEKISNISGKFIYFASKTTKQVFGIELKIEKNYMISLNSVTFTNSEGQGGKLYKLLDNNSLRLKTKSDIKGPFYSISQYAHTRHATPFCDISLNKFHKTKMGILHNALKTFNDEYLGMVHLVLKRENNWEKIDTKNATSLKKDHLRNLKRLLENKTIRIVNKITDNLSKSIAEEFCEALRENLEKLFTSSEYFLKNDRKLNFEIKIGKYVKDNDLNIILIHNKQYYEENPNEKDPYESFIGKIVQHVTLEDFSTSLKDEYGKEYLEPKESALRVIINELLIKLDLSDSQKKISLVDWTRYSFKNDYIFCRCVEEWKHDEKYNKNMLIGKHFIFMKIHPDGTFEIGEVQKGDADGIVSQNVFSIVEEIFKKNDKDQENHNDFKEKYVYVVINDKGDINIIQDTRYEMYPDFDLIANELYEKGKVSRKNETNDEFFLGSIDIHYKEEENGISYAVGEISHGLSGQMQTSTLVRRIIPYNKSALFSNNLLETMNVVIVRNGRLTVFPFPFKYIREYMEEHNYL